jgi:hypothetical protein
MSTATETPDGAVPAAGGLPSPATVAGSLWFLALALLYGQGFPALVHAIPAAHGAFAAWAPLASRGCSVVFFITMAWLMMVRPPAIAGRPGLITLLIALTGTYGVWVVAFLPQAPLPPTLAIFSAATTLVGSVLIVFTVLHLGRSFSIAPQARELVTRGPYAS